MTAPTHPWAWWGWALVAAATVSLTRNPLLVVLVMAAVAFVVLARRSDAPWARSVGAYFVLALVIVAIRVTMQVFFGGLREGPVLFTLPEVRLPDWAAGIRLGGPVTLSGVLFALYDGLRLAAIIICVGAANALANPRRALKNVPAALHELSVAVVIALSVAPQLVESLHRVRRARRLRGGAAKGWRAVTAVLVPVMEDAVERSMQLAASMESRGFGRTRDLGRVGPGLSLLLVGSVLLVTFGSYLLLGVPDSRLAGLACLALGVAAAVLGLRRSGRRLSTTRYRPDRWTWRETAVVAAATAALIVVLVLQGWNPAVLQPTTTPPVWPSLHPLFLPAAALVAAPVLVTERGR
ncbi:energy-coupling factor transporter transmembrane component T [Aestuariimicrobium ganziense]|uniref:energy-coupling factor transporter transmembrane component T n=1 Tax=Aestuariimicrobium ganziense TaxID=2773677 RepID=UPI002E2DF688|nr:energy-coupling factor transporter transmembrane component T [Aestuariimicrobium ganziense]